MDSGEREEGGEGVRRVKWGRFRAGYWKRGKDKGENPLKKVREEGS